MKMNPACPRCFTETGFTIQMEFQNGIYHCSKNNGHKYTMDNNGFFVFYRP